MPTEKNYEEANLIALLAEDNQYAFQLIFDKYRNKVYRNAMLYIKSPAIAEDIVQDIFIKLWFQRKNLSEIVSLESWIHQMTKNHTINSLKKLAHEWNESQKWIKTVNNIENVTADHKIRLKEYDALMQQIIEKLPLQQQKVYLLAKEEGFSYEAIASELCLSPFTVKTHMARALASIRLSLRNNGMIFR